jgi:DNA primase
MKRTLDEALAEGRGVERAFSCHMHDDTRPSASVNVSLGVWYCYTCHARGTVAGYVPDPAVTLSLLTEEVQPVRHTEAWLDLFDAHHPSPYWSERIGAQAADWFRCGTHPLTGQPTYPVRDLQGRVLGVVVRNEDGRPKYRYPAGLAVSGTFYSSGNRLERLPVAVLVEGAPDVMALYAEGLPDGWQVLGCFGAGLHAPQVAALESIQPRLIVAAFDADTAGRDATERARCQTDGIGSFVTVDWSLAPPETPEKTPTDPGEVRINHRTTHIANAITHHMKDHSHGRRRVRARSTAAAEGSQGPDH